MESSTETLCGGAFHLAIAAPQMWRKIKKMRDHAPPEN
jgi:hypothetical protein